jgi:acetyl-CoA decarbonylase/synthase complex subunit gamma
VGRDGYSASRVQEVGIASAAIFLATCVGCLVLGPALLPWLPGRSFSLKGLWVALALLLAYFGLGWFPAALSRDWPSTLAWCLLLPAAGSTLVMKFTGASTYTSLSGVRREMRVAMPIQLACAILGLLVWLVGRFA